MPHPMADTLYSTLVEDPTSCRPRFLADQLHSVREIFVAEGNVRAREIAIMAVAFTFYATEHYQLGKRFAPYPADRFVPDWSDPALPDSVAASLRSLADSCPNSIHRARFRDLLWDRSRDARSGIAAIGDYLDAAAICQREGWDMEGHDYLRRASQLTMVFKQTALAAQVEAAILNFVQFLESAGRVHWYARIAALLSESAPTDVSQQVAEGLRRVADKLRHDGEYHLYRRTLQTACVFQRRLRDETTFTALVVEVGLSYVLEAESPRTATNFARAHHYQEAISHFANIGYTEPLNALKLKLKEAVRQARETEMHEIWIPLPEMSADDRRAMTDIFLTDTLDNALAAAAMLFIPNVQEARERAESLKGDSFFRAFATPERLNEEDNVSAAPRSDQERDVFWILEEVMRDVKLKHGFLLSPTLERLRQAGGLVEETLVSYLQTGAAFNRRDNRLLSHGLHLYFTGDYVGALHVLVPQVEAILRGCLPLIGTATTSMSHKNQAVMNEKPLGVVFEEESLKKLLGEDVITYLDLVYNDARGMNLRNELAHGVAAYAVFNRMTADTVIHTLLVLSLIRLEPKSITGDGPVDPTQEDRAIDKSDNE